MAKPKSTNHQPKDNRSPRRPKGSYPLPNGDVVRETVHRGRGRRIRVRGIRHAQPNLELLAKALIAVAAEEYSRNLAARARTRAEGAQSETGRLRNAE